MVKAMSMGAKAKGEEKGGGVAYHLRRYLYEWIL